MPAAYLLAQTPTQPEPSTKAVEAAGEDVGGEDPIVLTTRLTPEKSSIGDLLRLEITAAYPAGYSVNLPSHTRIDPMHVAQIEEGQSEPTGSGFRKTFDVRLQAFDLGELEVPPFRLTVVDPNGRVTSRTVGPLAFNVDALLANESAPERKGEDPALSLPYPNESLELAVYAFVLALVLGVIGGIYYWRWKNRPKAEAYVAPIPPHDRANAALDRLAPRAQKLLEEGYASLYYIELTEIMKRYLEERFGIDMLDRTTDEIRRALISAGETLKPLSDIEIMKFLQEGDLIKFARQVPDVEEALRTLSWGREIVIRSTPVQADPAAAAVDPANQQRDSGAK